MKTRSILVIFCMMTLFIGCRQEQEEYTVMKGKFLQSFTETGELEATSSVAITIPRIRWEYGYDFKIVGMVENGTLVKTGDTVVRIDPSSIQKSIITAQESLEGQRAATKKQQVQMENNIQELKAQLRSEEAMYDLAKLELERSKFDTDNRRKVKELEFKQSTIRMEKLKRQLKRKPILDNYDFKIQKIKEIQVETDLAGAREALSQMTISSPKDGLFQVGKNNNQWPPKDLKPGDEVYSGGLVARIPDIRHMQVKTFVNEADITKVFEGLKVLVRLDALPEIPFHGTIRNLSKVCVSRDKDKVFNVMVDIDESDLRLKPGMTVSCEYICKETDNSMYVANNCVLKEEGKFYVFLKKGGSVVKTEVKAGPANSNHTLIYSGVEPGQALIPFEQALNKTKS